MATKKNITSISVPVSATENININIDEFHTYIMIGAEKAYADAQAENEQNMADIVYEYQVKFNTEVDRLYELADTYDKITYGVDYAKAADIMKKLSDIGDELLDTLGDYTNCSMGPDDGYWLNTERLYNWCHLYESGMLGATPEDMLDFYEDMRYMALYEDRVCPISDDDIYEIEVLAESCYKDKEDWTESEKFARAYIDWIEIGGYTWTDTYKDIIWDKVVNYAADQAAA